MKTLRHTIATIISVAFLASVSLCAQTDSLPDSKGRDFWFCFLPNFHNDGIDDFDVQRRDSLYIFVASEKPTNVRLEYRDSAGTLYSRNFRITDPTKMLSIGERFYPFELMGFNRCGSSLDITGGQNLTVARQSFHLSSDEDVTVYAMDQALTTSDAFLVLPTDALGNQYYIMSYTADPSSGAASNTPSEFAIVATEDSTDVRIETVAPVYRFGRPPSVVRLNKGQVYLVQSTVGDNFTKVDLTGSLVTTTKPVSVFSGHQRATIPYEDRNNRISRDCLIEQMTPISTWGHGALLVPYPEPADAVVFDGDKYRILAAYDSTVIYIDSVYQTTLDAGEFLEGDLRVPHVVFATRAVLVAQFKHTSSVSGGGGGGGQANHLGDPFMMTIPPSNQFLKSYRFVNVQASKIDGMGNRVITYEEQWLTVVLPTTSVPKLRVDSLPPAVTFKAIPKSNYSYAHIRMQDGVHTVDADTGVGIYVYGYGIANSYGYVGGMAYKRYDFNAPQLLAKADCYQLKGASFDTALADSKVVSLTVLKDSTFNVNTWLEPFIPPVDSVHFTATLMDDLQDGSVKLETRDLEGYVTRHRFGIPGFTLRLADTNGVLSLSQDTVIKPGLQRTYCHDYHYVNIGRYDQKVNAIRSTAPVGRYTISSTFPATVKPGDTLHFTICYRFETEGDFFDTLFVDVGCNPRPLFIFTASVGQDTIKPKITIADDNCRSHRIVTLSDVGKFQTGLRTIRVVDSANCTIQTTFTAESSIVDVRVTDWRLDAWYSFFADDSVGNAISFSDTVEGFTVMYSNIDSASHFLRMNDQYYKNSQCDTIELYNFGMFPKSFASLPLLGNSRYSFPQHQLPLNIAPGQKARVAICYYPDAYPRFNDSLWRDTLVLSFGCHTRDLEFAAGLKPQVLTGNSRCDIPIRASGASLTGTTMSSIFPSPSAERINVMVSSDVATTVQFVAVNALSERILLSQCAVTKGDQVLSMPVDFLASGVYTVIMLSESGTSSIQHAIIH